MSESLTVREIQVLRLVALGKGNREIARIFHIGVRTVQVHRKRAMVKLDLKSADDIWLYAIRTNLIEI